MSDQEPYPRFEFNEETSTYRVTDLLIDEGIHKVLRRLAEQKEAALKDALTQMGWIAPEDVAAHDAEVARAAEVKALREAADEFRNEGQRPFKDGVRAWLYNRATRIESGADEGGAE